MSELVCAADSPDWLAKRREGVTATDIIAIVGLSPYESAYSLFFKKRGDIPDEHQDNDRLRLGRELESYIIARWREACLPPEGLAPYHKPNLYRSAARPWQMATPDCAVWTAPASLSEPADAVLEVKSWADADRDRWHDGPPARVRAQVLWQMDTLDVATGHVGVLFLPSGEFRSYVIEHDPMHAGALALAGQSADSCSLCTDTGLLRMAGLEFVHRLEDNDAPSPDASSATLAALKARFTDVHHDKEAEIDAVVWTEYAKAKARSGELDDFIRGHEALIREQAGEARTLTVNGTKVATHVRTTYTVAAHDAYERTTDYIRRATSKGDSNGA